MRLFVPTAVAIAWLCGCAHGGSSTVERDQLEALLAKPPDDPAWRSLRPDAEPVLGEIARDGRAPRREREAAVEALARLGTASGHELLCRLLAEPDLGPEQRQATARILVAKDGPAAADTLSRILGNPDPAVRAVVAAALGRLGGRPARTALIRQLEREADPGVRDVLHRSLIEAGP